MPDIFLSYTNEDAEFAARLKHCLERRHYTAGAVEHHAPVGEPWADVFADELRDARAIVVIISKAHYQVGLPRYEVAAAAAYGKYRGKPLTIPIVVGDVQLPPFLRPFLPIRTAAVDPDAVDIASQIAEVLETHTGLVLAKEERQKQEKAELVATVSDFVEPTQKKLLIREKRFGRVAYLSYSFAFLSLAATLSFSLWRYFQPTTISEWPALLEHFVMAMVVLGCLVALAKFSHSIGKHSLAESIRNSDRMHAIECGRFFLKARGEKMEFSELKEAFQQWNIDKESHFLRQDAKDYDPQFFQRVVDFVKAVAGIAKTADPEKES